MNKKFLSAAVTVAAVVALFVFPDVSLDRQVELARSLLAVSAIVFAILGVWVSVLDPTVVLDQQPAEEISARTRLAMRFSPLLQQMTIVLALVVALQFILPLIPEARDALLGVTRGICGFFVTLLYIWQVGILVATLLPVTRSGSAITQHRARRRFRSNRVRRSAQADEKPTSGTTL